MSLSHTLLGLLSYKPMTGYEIKQLFDCSIQHFWNAHISQIYRELTRMDEKGWIVHHTQEQTSKPDKKIYSITDTGSAEFMKWLQDFPADFEKVERNEFLVRIFFASRIDKAALTYELKRYIRKAQEQLDKYKNIGTEIQTESENGEKDAFFWRMTLRRGILSTEAAIKWAEECLQLIEEER